MNLSVKRIALLFSFASAILTTSCDDPSEIGLPQGQSLGVSVKEDFTINTATVLVDSVQTTSSTYMMVGRYQDPKLGPVTATNYFQPTYSAEFTVQNPTRADSAVLFLPYTYFYGDTARPYTISVHLLQDSIRTKVYYSTEQLPYESSPAVQATFSPRPNSADSIRTLRVKLPASVADQLLSFANKSVTEFEQGFPGFALVGAYPNNNIVLGFPASEAPRLRLYYQTTTAQTFDFVLVGNRRFNHISGNRTGTVVESLGSQYSSVPSTAANPEAYLQGGTGIMARIEFPNLITALRQQRNVAINKAELIVTPLTGSLLSTRSRLILYDATVDGKLLRLTDGLTPQYVPGDIIALNQAPALAAYTNNAFTFNVTRYVADVLQNKRSNNGLFLSFPSAYDQRLSGTGITSETTLEQSISSMYLGGHNHPTTPLKLRIYYTPLTSN